MRPMRRQDRAITDPAKILGVIDAHPEKSGDTGLRLLKAFAEL